MTVDQGDYVALEDSKTLISEINFGKILNLAYANRKLASKIESGLTLVENDQSVQNLFMDSWLWHECCSLPKLKWLTVQRFGTSFGNCFWHDLSFLVDFCKMFPPWQIEKNYIFCNLAGNFQKIVIIAKSWQLLNTMRSRSQSSLSMV